MFAASNVDRLRDFIKHVYVDKRFTGERSYDKPPRSQVVKCLLSPVIECSLFLANTMYSHMFNFNLGAMKHNVYALNFRNCRTQCVCNVYVASLRKKDS